MAGKGDAPRPLSVPPAAFADSWERTFMVAPRRAAHRCVLTRLEPLLEDQTTDPPTRIGPWPADG